MSEMTLTPGDPTPNELQYLEDRIYEFNASATGIADGELLAFFVREDDRIVAGICSFQAPAFYERHGLEVVATIDDHPRGHQNLLMRKRLQSNS
jgi:hypothetical protein